MLRFIDGLTALNDGGETELNFKDIYLPEPVLKMENLGNDDESFLNLLIKKQNNKFSFQFYDMKYDFLSSRVRMFYLRSNIPSKMFYFTYRSEILRTIRTTSSKHLFSCTG